MFRRIKKHGMENVDRDGVYSTHTWEVFRGIDRNTKMKSIKVYGLNQSLALCPLSNSGPSSVTSTTSSNLTPAIPSMYTPIISPMTINQAGRGNLPGSAVNTFPARNLTCVFPLFKYGLPISPPPHKNGGKNTVHVPQSPIHVPIDD